LEETGLQAPEELAPERRWYSSAGLTIASSIPLDDLARPCAPGVPDVVVEEVAPSYADRFAASSTHAMTVGDTGAPWLEVRRGDGGFLARWHGQLDVIVPDDGRRMLVAQRGEVPDSIPRLLLCHAMSFVLPAFGREGLHASAVEIGGRAIAIAGQSGRGKSTLATTLCMQGARLLADDLVSLRRDGDVLYVEPTTNRTWLADELATQIAGEGSRGVSHRLGKVSVGGDSLELSGGAVPLAAVYVLGYRMGEAEMSEPLPRAQAMTETLGALFNFAVRSPQRLAAQFDVVTHVAATIPVRTLRWEPTPAGARDIAKQMVAFLRDPEEPGEMSEPTNGHAPARGVAATLRRDVIEKLRAAGLKDLEVDLDEEPLLRTSQVAALLRSSDRTIRTWADAGKLPYIKTLGGRRLFPASGVMAVLQKMRSGRAEEE
jgi:excisionase family DNA binding protein